MELRIILQRFGLLVRWHIFVAPQPIAGVMFLTRGLPLSSSFLLLFAPLLLRGARMRALAIAQACARKRQNDAKKRPRCECDPHCYSPNSPTSTLHPLVLC